MPRKGELWTDPRTLYAGSLWQRGSAAAECRGAAVPGTPGTSPSLQLYQATRVASAAGSGKQRCACVMQTQPKGTDLFPVA